MRKIVIVGATSHIARKCIEIWNREPIEITLIARDSQKLDIIRDDIIASNEKSSVTCIITELDNPQNIKKILDDLQTLSSTDNVLIAHGTLPDNEQSQSNVEKIYNDLHINAISPIIFLECLVGKMKNNEKSNIAIIGSVAGDRGRKSNYIYGSAKGMIETYVEGLQHRLADSSLSITLIKPGPTETPMTMNFKSKVLKLSDSRKVARDIIEGIRRNKPIVYTPTKWKYIMMIIKLLPRFIFNKLDI